jgi:hypothetical protein
VAYRFTKQDANLMRRITTALMLTLLPVMALAETAPTVVFGTQSLLEKKAKPGPPDVKASPTVWPRLDTGAVLCRSEADLSRLAANRRGEGGGPADCQIIRSPTGVSVLQRKPGRTQVQLSGATTIGWTDVWMPEKAPAGAGR